MLMYPAWVLKEMKRICEAAGVWFIADEVMTGWGRTGTLFACEQADVVPDIACYSKGLTGGALPLAVTLCRPEIFDAHFSHDRSRTFFHSSSYTANPIACAAAKANLDLWEDPVVLADVADVAAMQERALAPFRSDRRFKNVRRTGSITGMDLNVRDSGYLADVGPKLLAFFANRNLLLRPLGNTIYVMPPYCVTQADLDEIYAAIAEAASL
jgi:adenosylmethionine---8-amino-7-oxononanoate aminotransferase